MKLRTTLAILGIIGGFAFGAASVSAHCGNCAAGDKKEEHACPADCQKECCKGKEKHAADCKCDKCTKEKSAHPADCACDTCKAEKKKDS